MIRLLKLGVVVGLLWSLYWYGAAYSLRQGISGWFAAQAARGWQADFADISTSGYPLRHITTLTSPALADPVTGTAWQADWLHLDNPAIWPGRQSLIFPAGPQRLSYFDQTVVLSADGMVADLHLAPGTDLALQRMALTSGSWQISGRRGPVAGAQGATVAMVQTGNPETYQFDVAAPGFTPGDFVRRAAGADLALPASFETLELDMQVQFDRPWDRRALEDRRPQPVAIDLRLASAKWGALSVYAAGQVTVDGDGVPTGNLALKAENWRDMLLLLQRSGALPEIALEATARLLNMLSGISGNPDALDVDLTLQGGLITLGPFPLGPAPRLFLR
ncbi:DUF2125 domain-containing protein [Sedimentitalea sp. HM32M-2]|uniref:DUF2125 domain-containing protein n=1 Tax=Sedimentitalea sp. HM32M-2 TaxID=3351566 RepID=UPI00363925D7